MMRTVVVNQSLFELAEERDRLRQELSLAEEGLANYEEENARLKQRCWAMAFLLYPLEDGPREAVAGDLGLRSPQTAEQK